MKKIQYERLIKNALLEDMPYGDITTESLDLEDYMISYSLIAKDQGIFAGMDLFNAVFKIVDSDIQVLWNISDGDIVNKGIVLAEVEGRASSILQGERLALNFVQRMSGIATRTYNFVKATSGYHTKIVDTRKTTPLLRNIEKEAVRIGGGFNHRLSLSDAVMLKDNHISACGSISEAVRRVRKNIGHTIKIEVEVETIDQVKEAIDAQVDIIMLDNMSDSLIKEAIALRKNNVVFEASGNIDVERVKILAKLGVDVISVGSLTYGAGVLDLSMKKRG